MSDADTDLAMRAGIYRFFAEQCRAPLATELAHMSGATLAATRSALQRLHARHMIFLDVASGEIHMANPFSAIATDYKVSAGPKTWWANCAWDTLGIATALNIDVQIEAIHPGTREPLHMAVVNGEPTQPGWQVYFPLPCRQWYDDLVFT